MIDREGGDGRERGRSEEEEKGHAVAEGESRGGEREVERGSGWPVRCGARASARRWMERGSRGREREGAAVWREERQQRTQGEGMYGRGGGETAAGEGDRGGSAGGTGKE